jgi:mono/diheme cytochrome c family protein
MKKIRMIMATAFLSAVAAIFFLQGCSNPVKASVQRGEKVYTQYCLPCHQANGSGVSSLNPPLKKTAYVMGEDSSLIAIVLKGRSEGVEINGETYTNPMPSFGNVLKDEEIADVLTYVRNSFGNKAGAIKTEEVKQERDRK